MRTLVVSDLHLGGGFGVDVLRRAGPRAALIDALGDVDRLVLLGDVLELRHGPRRDALAVARPFFEDLGRAFAGREVIVVAGNHDHALVESWLRRREETTHAESLTLEQRFSAEDASSMLATLAAWAAPARVSGAYPGLWLRPDVYATHGHYLDCHLTVPTLERIGIGMTARALRLSAESFTTVGDYESVTGPVFAWIDAVARQAPTGATLNGQSTMRVWRALTGGRSTTSGRTGEAGEETGGRDRIAALAALAPALRRRALVGAFPFAIAALNRAGIGSFNADISGSELRRAGLHAMGEVAVRLGLGDAHVIFGHTHRSGPLPGDVETEWRGPAGARLLNTGCWTYNAYFLAGAPGESPYWPGRGVLVEDYGPPVLWRLLDDCDRAALGAGV
ncbi:MAG TPA: metallophosphoesterase [Solirubrobacteraceae bacterium]|nr:metallophosphoesterase [Solirubrobacteraceae bacterium]